MWFVFSLRTLLLLSRTDGKVSYPPPCVSLRPSKGSRQKPALLSGATIYALQPALGLRQFQPPDRRTYSTEVTSDPPSNLPLHRRLFPWGYSRPACAELFYITRGKPGCQEHFSFFEKFFRMKLRSGRTSVRSPRSGLPPPPGKCPGTGPGPRRHRAEGRNRSAFPGRAPGPDRDSPSPA